MKEPSCQPVFVAACNPDTVEMVSSTLQEEEIRVEVPDISQNTFRAFDASTARVLVFAFKQVEQSLQLLELFRSKSRRFQRESCRLVLLCDKLEARRAYQLCRQGLFDNYVVFWPLSFDPFRLSMAINQELCELEQQHQTQGRQDKLDGQQQVVSELEQILSRQLDGGHDLAFKIRLLLQAGLQPGMAADGAAGLQQGICELETSVRDFESLSSMNLRSLRLALNKVKNSSGTILLVEEDAFYRRMITAILKAYDFQVLTAGSAEAAMTLLQDTTPDLVLMDILMPDMTGPEAVRVIKSNQWMKTVPVIIISGHSQKEIIVECVQLGASAFVAKPFSRQLLMDKVQAVLKLPSLALA